MLKINITLLFCLQFLLSLAQWEPPARIELNATDKSFEVVKANNQNLLIVSVPDKDNGSSRKKWTLTIIGPDLQLVWEKQAEMVSDHLFQASETVDQISYLFFTTYEKRKYAGPDYQIVILNHQEKTMKIINGKTEEKASFIAFDVIDQNILAAFNYKNKNGVILMHNPENENVKQLTLTPGENHQILDLKADRISRFFVVASNSMQSKKKDQLILQSFNLDGQTLMTCPVQNSDNGYRIIDAYLDVSVPMVWTLTGVFNNLNERTQGTDGIDEILSNGVCFVKVNNGVQESAKFYNFLDFENIDEIFNKQDGAAMYKKLEKEKKKSSEADLKFNTILLPPLVDKDKHLFLIETYSTEYQIVNRYSYDFYGRVYPQSYSVFDGYRYYNAFTGEFDNQGNLVWTNGIALRDLKNYELTRHVEVYHADPDVVLIYSSDGKIASRVINKFSETGPFERARIELKYQADQLVNDTRSMVVHWHDQYFFACGYQTVRNSSLKNMTRKVFYINKIALDL